MSKLKVSQNVIEVLGSYSGTLKVSHDVIEVLQAMPGTLPDASVSAVTGVTAKFPGDKRALASGAAARNVLGEFKTGPSTTTSCVVHITSAFSTGNVGIISTDGTGDQFTTATTGDKTFTNLLANTTYFLYSFNSGVYNAALTGAATFDYTGLPQPVGLAVSQHAIEVLLKDPGVLKVSQNAIEVLLADTVPAVAAGGATAHVSIT